MTEIENKVVQIYNRMVAHFSVIYPPYNASGIRRYRSDEALNKAYNYTKCWIECESQINEQWDFTQLPCMMLLLRRISAEKFEELFGVGGTVPYEY